MWHPSKNIVDVSATTVEGGAGFSLGSTCPITEERELNMMKASLAVGVRKTTCFCSCCEEQMLRIIE